VIQRRALVGIVVAASASMAGACGFDSPDFTTHEHNSVQAAEFEVGAVHVGDASITTLPSTGKSYLIVTLINEGRSTDSVTGIASSSGTIALTGAGVSGVGGTSLPLPPGVQVSIDQPLLSPAGPTATFTATTPPALGTFVPVQFTFATAGASPTEQVPVVPPDETTAATASVPTGIATPPPVPGVKTSD
jgi:hypothetical protein